LFAIGSPLVSFIMEGYGMRHFLHAGSTLAAGAFQYKKLEYPLHRLKGR